jgi:hypothetical protein
MMVGGVAGLLLQMLHPAVLAGVWDHSNFRADMHGRLRRTARFIALTTYGGREEAEAAIARVRRIHDRVGGALPDGTPYAANDPSLLAWVHVTEATCFLDAWIRYAEPGMPAAHQDRYFAEMARVGEALGADPVPRSRSEARRLLDATRPLLRSDARTREVARLILTRRAPHRWRSPCRRSPCRPRSTCCRRGRGACTGCDPGDRPPARPRRHARHRPDAAVGVRVKRPSAGASACHQIDRWPTGYQPQLFAPRSGPGVRPTNFAALRGERRSSRPPKTTGSGPRTGVAKPWRRSNSGMLGRLAPAPPAPREQTNAE